MHAPVRLAARRVTKTIFQSRLWASTWKPDILEKRRRTGAPLAVKMIHNTLKSAQPPEHSPRSTHSAAQRKLWRYSRHRGASQAEGHRHSVCVLAADLNPGGGGGGAGGGGGGGVMHTIHGLCHLCIGCRLPQVCVLEERDEGRCTCRASAAASPGTPCFATEEAKM